MCTPCTCSIFFISHVYAIVNRTRPLTFRAVSRCGCTAGSVCAAHLVILIILIWRKCWQFNSDACTATVARTNAATAAATAAVTVAAIATAATTAVVVVKIGVETGACAIGGVALHGGTENSGPQSAQYFRNYTIHLIIDLLQQQHSQ